MSPPDAARLGVYLHGKTGEHAAEKMGGRGVTSGDLADHLPAAMDALAAGRP